MEINEPIEKKTSTKTIDYDQTKNKNDSLKVQIFTTDCSKDFEPEKIKKYTVQKSKSSEDVLEELSRYNQGSSSQAITKNSLNNDFKLDKSDSKSQESKFANIKIENENIDYEPEEGEIIEESRTLLKIEPIFESKYNSRSKCESDSKSRVRSRLRSSSKSRLRFRSRSRSRFESNARSKSRSGSEDRFLQRISSRRSKCSLSSKSGSSQESNTSFRSRSNLRSSKESKSRSRSSLCSKSNLKSNSGSKLDSSSIQKTLKSKDLKYECRNEHIKNLEDQFCSSCLRYKPDPLQKKVLPFHKFKKNGNISIDVEFELSTEEWLYLKENRPMLTFHQPIPHNYYSLVTKQAVFNTVLRLEFQIMKTPGKRYDFVS